MITTGDRFPLAVRVYDRVIETLQATGVCAGHLVPPEAQLAADLGVSRTVMREALRLLEEDGVLERAPDRRRRQVAAPVDPAGFASPLEDLIRVPGRLTPNVVRCEVRPVTSWTGRLLGLSSGEAVLTRETVLLGPDGPVASAMEFIPAADPHAEAALTPSRPERTLLADLGEHFRRGLTPLQWRLSPSSVRSTRTGLERLPDSAVLGSLTTVLGRGGRPAHLAKHVLRLDAVVLDVTPGADDDEAPV